MSARTYLVVVGFGALLLAPSSYAIQTTEPAPATTQAEAGSEKLQATVTGVEGFVQVRAAEDQPWQTAAVGMVLDENAEFRTAPKSAVRFTIPPDQIVTLDRLGTVKVLQAVNDNGKLKTKLGMKYGRTRYDIEAAGREHESTISSPSSTLAVRGTKVSLYDQRPFVSEAISLTGRAEFRDARKRVGFGKKNAGKTKINVTDDSAADAALTEAVVDPGIALARSDAEAGLIETLLSRGATISYDFEKGIKVVRGGIPPEDQQLIPVLPGSLNFVLRWTGNADLNLAVLSPRSDPTVPGSVYPVAGLSNVPSGGRTGFDHRGGPSGGIEIVYWPGAAPEGVYQIGSLHISGDKVPASVDVFQGTERLDIRTSAGPVQTANFIAEPQPIEFGGQLAGSVRLFEEATGSLSATSSPKSSPSPRQVSASPGKKVSKK